MPRAPDAIARPLAALVALYTAQGLVHGFGLFVLLPRLQAAGVSLSEQAGVLAGGGAPWVLKFLWAPLFDRHAGPHSGGRRRALIAGLQLACAAVAGATAVSELDLASSTLTIAGLWLALNFAVSLQDVAADALAVDAIPARRRGLARGLMGLGATAGAGVLGGMWLSGAVADEGLAAGFGRLAATLALLAGFPLLLRPRSGERESAPPAPARALVSAFAAVVRRERAAALVAFAVVLGGGATQALATAYFLEHLELTPLAYAQTIAPTATAASLIGFALAAALVDRPGHARALALGTAALGLAWALYGLCDPLLADAGILRALVVVEGLATGLMYTALHAWLMDRTDARIRATQFVIYMALVNLATQVVGRLLGPPLLELLGFPWVWVACGGAQAALAAPILWLARR